MSNRTLILRSAVSGVMWAGIAVLMMWTVLGRYESVGDLAWSLRGGTLVAPLSLTGWLFQQPAQIRIARPRRRGQAGTGTRPPRFDPPAARTVYRQTR